MPQRKTWEIELKRMVFFHGIVELQAESKEEAERLAVAEAQALLKAAPALLAACEAAIVQLDLANEDRFGVTYPLYVMLRDAIALARGGDDATA